MSDRDVAVSPAEGEDVLFPWLRTMREEHPVWRDRYGVWHVFRHADVVRVMTDPATFSSNLSRINPGLSELARGSLTQLDPPEHRSLRRVVSAAFTPRTVADLEPRIDEVTRELLDGVEGEFDLVQTLAYPLPVTVIAELLGVPSSDRGLFRAWAERLLSVQVDDPTDPNLMTQVEDTIRELFDYLRGHCQDRRGNPRDDLLTALVCAEVEGRRLDDQEAVNFAMLLLLAGHITTTVLLGNAVRCLDEHPEDYAALRADPALIPGALEEVLRYRSPVAQVGRVTMGEVELAGQHLAPDTVVMPWLLSANRDERVFAAADRFDIYREHNDHIAFGRGVHFCLGAPLARLEARVALRIVLESFTQLRVVPDTKLVLYPRGVLGSRNLPVTAVR